jgi:hypothetical protein
MRGGHQAARQKFKALALQAWHEPSFPVENKGVQTTFRWLQNFVYKLSQRRFEKVL